MSESLPSADKRGEPVFLNVGKSYELCRFPGTGEWSLRLKLEDGDVSHVRYLDECETEMVEAALAYTPSHEQHIDGRWCADMQCAKCYSAETWRKSQSAPSTTLQIPTVEYLRDFVKLPADSAAHIQNLENALREAHRVLCMPSAMGTYTPDQQRAANYIVEAAGIGGGDDPVGFLIASHAFLAKDAALGRKLREMVNSGKIDVRNIMALFPNLRAADGGAQA